MPSRFLWFRSDLGHKQLDTWPIPNEKKPLAFQIAVETRRFEIERFWQRSLFFWGFLAVAFVAYGALDKPASWQARVFVSCFGIIASLAWTLQNRGAKYWQEAWEQKVNALEMAVLGQRLFRHTEPVELAGWFGASRYSVSRLAIIFSDFTVLVWIGLLARLITWYPDVVHGDRLAAAWIAITLVFAALLVFKGRSEGGGKVRP